MAQPKLYTRIPPIYKGILITIGMILSIVTLSLVFHLYYDFFFTHKYWLNRRILRKYLKTNPTILSKRDINEFNVTEYVFKDVAIWVYNKQLELNASIGEYNDVIGLFASSKSEDRMVIKLIRMLNRLNTEKNGNK